MIYAPLCVGFHVTKCEKVWVVWMFWFCICLWCLRQNKLTWFGISRLLLGSRTQFLHILLTRSSRMMTISWLQYWILTRSHFYSHFMQNNQRPSRWCFVLLVHLHGLVVNTEPGTLCWKSCVMWSASGGLRETRFSSAASSSEEHRWSDWRRTWAGWCRGRGPPGQEQTQSDCYAFRKTFHINDPVQIQADLWELEDPTCYECWDTNRWYQPGSLMILQKHIASKKMLKNQSEPNNRWFNLLTEQLIDSIFSINLIPGQILRQSLKVQTFLF